MNIWVEFLLVVVRAALVSTGTIMLQHGWISEVTAKQFSGPAAVWITAGVFVIGAAVAHSAWSKVQAAAEKKIALMFPSNSPASFVVAALKQLTFASWWYFARQLAAQTSAEDQEKLGTAVSAVKNVLSAHGFGDPVPPYDATGGAPDAPK